MSHEKMIPLISSDTSGPLGLKHLPRLWLKTLLSAHDQLAEGYKDVRPGYDFMILEGLKIEPDDARDFLKSQMPTYLEFEQWVKEYEGSDVSTENIERINKIVVARQKSEKSRKKVLEANGLTDDGTITDSIMITNLDDWFEIHQQLNHQG